MSKPDRNHPNLLMLCNIHNNISAEAIHLALHDMEESVLNKPEMSLYQFLDKLERRGIQRDNEAFTVAGDAKRRS